MTGFLSSRRRQVVAVDSRTWPEVGQPVVLVREDGADHRTLVEDHRGARLVVAVPGDHGWRARARAGDLVSVQWHSRRGLHSLVATVCGPDPAVAPMWCLEPTQQPQVDQRRLYVRAAARGALGVVSWVGDWRPEQQGQVLDLSEGGVRLRLPVEVAEGDPVRLAIEVEDRCLQVGGTVLRARESLSGTEVVIVFRGLTDADAAHLRQVVFAWQRASRR